MIQTIELYLLTTIVFFAIDMTWLGLVANKFYQANIGSLMKNPINWILAIVFYLLYVVGILFLAVYPGAEKDSLKIVIQNAAVFGFLAYATYDLTNLATLKNWALSVTVADLIWGTVLTTTVAVISFYLYRLVY